MTLAHPAAILAAAALTLAHPAAGLAQDLFVVSQSTAEVLRYDGGDGAFLEVFVEPITEGFSNPGGIALRTATGELYVTSSGTGEIWRYAAATGAVLAPPAATGLIAPRAAAFDAAGDALYFLAAETELSTGTDAILQLAIASGVVSTLASDAAANFSALAPNGSDLYASDALNGSVLRIPTGGGGAATVISGLASPGGILFASATEMLVAETGADRVVEYAFDGSSWAFQREVLAPNHVDGPFGLALAPDGTLSVSGSFSNDVVSVDLVSLAVLPLVAPRAGGLGNAGDLVWDGATLLAVSPLSNAVVYFDSAGEPTGTTARGLSAPSDSGMTVAPSGNLLIGSLYDNDIVEYDGAGGAEVGTFFDACPTSLAAPFDQIVGADGNLYVSCPASQGVFRFDMATGDPLGFFVSGGSGGLSNPRGLVFAPNGNLLVASGLTGEVLEYAGGSGAFVGVLIDASGNGGGALDPWGLAIRDGELYVASRFPSEVRRFDATTGAFVQTFVASGSGGLAGPTALAFGPAGDLFATSYDDDAIRRYDGVDGSFVEIFVTSGSGGLDGPIDLAFIPEPGGVIPFAAGVVELIALGALRHSRRRRS
jgi:DNA-binding beta-propeller fold protein YncE